jgi:hypothetical protein
VDAPLWVAVQDDHRFYAVGPFGLAWRLHRLVSSIHVGRQCPAARHCLRINGDGSWQLR